MLLPLEAIFRWFDQLIQNEGVESFTYVYVYSLHVWSALFL